MGDAPFSLVFAEETVTRALTACAWSERGDADNPHMQLHPADNPEASAGYVRFWEAPADSSLDRMLHMRLIAGPVETQLIFIFGRADTSMPHFHTQAVQFPPAGCVYNADLIPRVDPVDR